MTVIDLSPQLEDIRDRFPEWWREDAAIQELRRIWGGADCNEAGVFEDGEIIRIDLEGQPQWKASVKLAQAPNGLFAMATDYWCGLGGRTSPISVWNRVAFTTRDEAIETGVRELMRDFARVRDEQCAAGRNPSLASRMIERLQSSLVQRRQLELF